MKIIKKLIVKAVHSMGFDIVRMQNDPENNLLGLNAYPIRTVIDVGANRGQFAKRILKTFPDAKIYCFEPLPEAFYELEGWAKREMPNQIRAFNLAIGEKEGEVKMFHHLEHNDSSSLLETTELYENYYPITKNKKQVSVKLTTLDSAIRNMDEAPESEILIKVDTEGYEDRVIKGGKSVFKKARACILEICFDKLHDGQPYFSDIFRLMDDLGFQYVGNLDQIQSQDGHVIYVNAVFLRK